MVTLGDSLVPLLAPHYTDEEITRLFAPEPYPTPLLPMLSPSARQNTEPLFLPERASVELPVPSMSLPPLDSARQTRRTPLVRLPPTPEFPAAGSLEAELAAAAAYEASEKEREAQRLKDFIQTNTDPTGRGRHASAKDKRKAQSPKEKRSVPSSKDKSSDSKSKFLPSSLDLSYSCSPHSSLVDVSKLLKNSEGLAIWPPLPGPAAAAPQVPNEVMLLHPCCSSLLIDLLSIVSLQPLRQARCGLHHRPDFLTTCGMQSVRWSKV